MGVGDLLYTFSELYDEAKSINYIANNKIAFLVTESKGYVYNLDTKELVTEIVLNSTYISASAMNSNNIAIVAEKYGDGYVKGIDPSTGNFIFEVIPGNDGIEDIDINSDETKIVAASKDNNAYVLDATNGDKILTFSEHTNSVNGTDLNGDTRVATCSTDNTVKIWNISDGSIITNFTQHETRVNKVKFNFDGSLVVSGDDNGIIKVWDPDTGDVLLSIEALDGNSVGGLDFNFDGSLIAVQSHYGSLEVLSGINGKSLYIKDYGGKAVKFTDEGKILAAYHYSNEAVMLENYNMKNNVFIGDSRGRARNTNTGITLAPLDLGAVRYAENSDIMELYFENRTDVQIGDIVIKAKDGTLNTGVVAEFSKTLDPFDALSQLNFAGPYNPGEKQVFYMRIDSDNTADPNVGSFELEVTGLNV